MKPEMGKLIINYFKGIFELEQDNPARVLATETLERLSPPRQPFRKDIVLTTEMVPEYFSNLTKNGTFKLDGKLSEIHTSEDEDAISVRFNLDKTGRIFNFSLKGLKSGLLIFNIFDDETFKFLPIINIGSFPDMLLDERESLKTYGKVVINNRRQNLE